MISRLFFLLNDLKINPLKQLLLILLSFLWKMLFLTGCSHSGSGLCRPSGSAMVTAFHFEAGGTSRAVPRFAVQLAGWVSETAV